MRKAPAIIRKWKRVTAVGCTHGDLASKGRLDEVLKFVDRYQPEVRFDLGDIMDTAAFRSGARGTKDETQPIAPDNLAAIEWMRRYRPTHLTWGNHDWRLVEWMNHYNATLAFAAATVWGALQDEVRRMGVQTRPYHISRNSFYMGGVHWMHGFMFNQNAVRDHAEMVGGRVVMAHLHTPEQVPGRVINAGPSFCVGTLADVDKLSYADRNRSKTRWGAGVVFGEMCETESHLWLASAKPGEPLRFPPGV